MLKKAIAIMTVLLTVASGVASVSAYEAHIIDIKAHVENALGVPAEFNIGTVFPQEVVETQVCFGLSESFLGEGNQRYSDVHYALLWEVKPIAEEDLLTTCDPDGDGDYEPLAPFIVLSTTESNDHDDVGSPDVPGSIAWGELYKNFPPATEPGDICDCWHITFDVPVFEEWYNPGTDPNPDPNILPEGTYCVVEEDICGQTVLVPHADLGSNLKIQVFEYSPHVIIP